jgi:hypothetical protein
MRKERKETKEIVSIKAKSAAELFFVLQFVYFDTSLCVVLVCVPHASSSTKKREKKIASPRVMQREEID